MSVVILPLFTRVFFKCIGEGKLIHLVGVGSNVFISSPSLNVSLSPISKVQIDSVADVVYNGNGRIHNLYDDNKKYR